MKTYTIRELRQLTGMYAREQLQFIREAVFDENTNETTDDPEEHRPLTTEPVSHPGSVGPNPVADLAPKKDKQFGSWLLRHYSKFLPQGISPEEASVWIDTKEHRSSLPQTPDSLRKMFKLRNMLRRSLGTPERPGGGSAAVNYDLDRVQLTPEKKPGSSGRVIQADKNGMMNFDDLGKALGVSGEAANQAYERVMKKAKKYTRQETETGMSGKHYHEEEFSIDPEEFSMTIETAAEKYVSYLKKYLELAAVPDQADDEDGDVLLNTPESFFVAFNNMVLKSKGLSVEELTEDELEGIRYLIGLVQSGKDVEAEQTLIHDIADPKEENVMKTFQNLAATMFHPETRGRRPGSKNQTPTNEPSLETA